MKLRFLTLVAAAAIVWAGPAFAINKCVGKDGKIAYSDQACPGASTATRIEAPTTLPPGAASASSSSPAASSAASAALPPNVKILQACASGGTGACFQKELLDKKCLKPGSDRIDTSTPECQTYYEDSKRFKSLKDDCRDKRLPAACFTLACAGGDTEACGRMKAVGNASEDREAMRKLAAREQGLPQGTGWYMHQDWYKGGDGRMTTSVICDGRNSVGLTRKPPILDRIFTSMTGEEYFATIDAAAKKACSLASKR